MSRREQIKMTPDEVRAYLETGRVANVATIGPKGRPHIVPVFYIMDGDGIATWTYGTSQKVANLRRLAEATVLVESGVAYEELQGVSMECDVEIVEDTEQIVLIGTELLGKMSPGNTEVVTAAAQFIRTQAEKRVGLVFRPTKVVSWDHRKLGGTY
ncbi:pyridoxamine 5'-phosphate oxidase family protein [Kibdelosporangium phytohabitans]|uniref:Pyridoxamine 5'-phosphate oxidase n=1 Tax=Kibdelosporangium phytohabitans TaxID=860235 RepID=A0A0N9ICT9_9PSEU|nr:pyridoxamine 5'-phosphate oxidase family protein [Kibdelosporangium phytohabitans]ALG14269.1 pyridoxamine 5'-phosphate oxidase [Kibdelosporangium phytohabitans]MBE1466724.1 general stress protein 26 [Kibdelosporangium phytohabitans]